MDDIFEEFVGFLMLEEAANTNEEVVIDDSSHHNHQQDQQYRHHSSTLAPIIGRVEDDPLLTSMMSSSDYDIINYERDYQSGRDLSDPPHNQSGGLIYQSDELQSDNILLDITHNFQANCSINQYYDTIKTSTLQQQQAADVCYDHPQAQTPSPSIPYLIDNVSIDADDNKLLDRQPSTAPGPHVREQEHGQQALPITVTNDVQGLKKRRRQQKQVLVDHVEDEEEEEEDVDLVPNEGGDDDQSSPIISKNLMSERNRRKRLNQQLFTLRSIVPNITKMDKRTVLVDALAHLQNILRQTEIEIENQNKISSSTAVDDHGDAMVDSSVSPNSSVLNVKMDHIPCHGAVLLEKNVADVNVDDDQLQPLRQIVLPIEPAITSLPSERAIFPAIIKMEAEKLDEERYLIKIVFNKVLGTMGQVQRSVEMLKGVDFINVSVSEYDQHHMQSSCFLRVKKIKGSLPMADEDNILNMLKATAKQLGLLLSPAAYSSE
ncbi:uncharacterized protein LOC113291546 [Papaver somniferum]|uniref:uncharacterized protein LOC113291546 n=1 Tax=Papaver somniferum TaxID=3469 RepID=UPI000E7030A0|nr:uncharacterized protein LOC113291546 [Papaver somniferum]